MREVRFLQELHTATKRDYLARMNAEKPECMRVAKKFGEQYWDGDRKFGYGGYKYDGRWKAIAEKIIKYYAINKDSYILDIGCGKGHLMHEISGYFSPREKPMTNGCDISEYAINHSISMKAIYSCTNLYNFQDAYYNLTTSINVFHNLNYKDLKKAIKEMVRITKPDGNSYICVESYRNEEELTNLQAWQLTCLSYYSPDDWKEILTDNGYRGDVEFITFV